MGKCITEIKFNSSIVELEVNKDYEQEVQEEFTQYSRMTKPYMFKSFVDHFMKNKKEEEEKEIGLKVLKMVPMQ